jgi:hypothetical protein
MTTSKLTWHFQVSGGCEEQQIAQASEARWIKVMDPPSDNPFPGKQIIARTYMEDGQANALVAQGAAGADRWFAHWRPIYESRAYVTLWEAPNEPQPIESREFRRQLVAFTQRWADLMHGIGRKVLGLCLSVGNPEMAEFAELLPVIPYVDGIATHEYAAPRLDTDAGNLILRYRRYMDVIRTAGKGDPDWYLTELGWDGGTIKPIPLTKKGWKSFATLDSCLEQLAWLDSELRKDPKLIVGTLYTSRPNGDWADFDINVEFSRRLAAHLAATREPPPLPPPPPPVTYLPENEPDGPAAKLAVAVRWWMEESIRQDETGDTARARAIRYSLIKLNGGLLYRLERKLQGG